MKICLIGCGSMVMGFHGPALAKYSLENAYVVLAACCDLEKGKAENCQQQFGFEKSYTDYKKMLAAEKPDAVCLVIPVQFTAQVACEILLMGYPLLTEKPPGMTVVEIDEMIAAAEKSQVQNQTAFNRRFMPLTQALKMELSRFSAEEIHSIRYDFHRVGRLDPDFSTTAIHAVDTARFLSGSDYADLDITYQPFPDKGEYVANINLLGHFQSGARVDINYRPISGIAQEKVTITLHDHTFILDIPVYSQIQPDGRLCHFHKGELCFEQTGHDAGCDNIDFIAAGFFGGNATFLDAVYRKRSAPGPIADGRQSVAVMEALRQRKTKLGFNI